MYPKLNITKAEIHTIKAIVPNPNPGPIYNNELIILRL